MNPSVDKQKKEFEAYLKRLDKKELYELIYTFAKDHSDIENYILANILIGKKDIDGAFSVARDLNSDIWNNVASDTKVFVPDFTLLTNVVKELLDAGYADQILDLGNEIIDNCRVELETEYEDIVIDEDATITAITPLLEVIKDAVLDSSLSDDERLLWLFDATLLYGTEDICQPFVDYISDDTSKDDWDPVVDILLERMEEEDFEEKYAPNILEWCKHAFSCAGRIDEFPYDL
ncbi:MAG: hypothetical protein IJU76_05760 [Desulfovibrionaceae bacterium]|nr:hypothetical protein [Desulfovibrionaceae bacterium]